MEKGILRSVDFYGDRVWLVAYNGEPFVPVRPIAENLGLNWPGQQRKFLEDARRWQVKTVKVEAQDGKLREMLCLPLRKLPAWLMSISASKVKPEIREKLIKYQEECDQVLWSYWLKGRAENPRLNGGVKTEKPRVLPLSEHEFTGRTCIWYIPLGLLARMLQVEAEDLLKLLPPGTYMESPDLANFLREQFPEAAHYLKNSVVVFDSGIRRLFIRNLIEEKKTGYVPEISDDFKAKVFKTLEHLERRGISFSAAIKLVRARKAGFTMEEAARALGFTQKKVSNLEKRLKELGFWNLV